MGLPLFWWLPSRAAQRLPPAARTCGTRFRLRPRGVPLISSLHPGRKWSISRTMKKREHYLAFAYTGITISILTDEPAPTIDLMFLARTLAQEHLKAKRQTAR